MNSENQCNFNKFAANYYKLKLENFIARRILGKDKKFFSYPILPISVTSIALGLAVMIIAVSVVTGFQEQIRNKIIGFGGHIQIKNYDNNESLEPLPILNNQNWLKEIKEIKGVKHVQAFAQKAGVIKTETEIEGVILKGVGCDFNSDFFSKSLIQGKMITWKDSAKSDEILISKYLTDKLKLKLGNKVFIYFIQDPPRIRKFSIAGIYDTGFEEFDKKFVISDIGHIQKLNNWKENQVAGFEVLLDDYKDIDKLSEKVSETVGYDIEAKSIKQLHPEIFDWLKLFDMNVVIIIVIMSLVSAITMISTLLIIILEKTRDIGILKALGANNWMIRKIILIKTLYILGKGLLLGNLIALSLCIAQLKFGLIHLNQQSYYMPYVPVNLNFQYIFLINLFTFILCLLLMIGPSFIITRISPVKAIRFD